MQYFRHTIYYFTISAANLSSIIALSRAFLGYITATRRKRSKYALPRGVLIIEKVSCLLSLCLCKPSCLCPPERAYR